MTRCPTCGEFIGDNTFGMSPQHVCVKRLAFDPDPMTVKLKSKATIDEAVMAVTKLWAELRSKDPSTKVGACVYDHENGGMHLGYNGFPAGVEDLDFWWNNRDAGKGITKYELVVHAETNAVRKAMQAGVNLATATLYCTHVPCPACMRDLIGPCGIKRVVYETYEYASNDARAEIVRASLARELGIKIEKIERKRS